MKPIAAILLSSALLAQVPRPPITWAEVVNNLITQLPLILTGMAALVTAYVAIRTRTAVQEVKQETVAARAESVAAVQANTEKTEEIREHVNSKLTDVITERDENRSKLDASLKKVSEITGDPLVNAADAPMAAKETQ